VTRQPQCFVAFFVAALASALSASSAWGAVPRDGMTFSPRNGAELLEAVGIIGAIGPQEPKDTARIELADSTYVIDRALSFPGNHPVELVGPEDGDAVVTNRGAAPTRLLHGAADVNWSLLVRYVSFEIVGTTSAALSVVDVGKQAVLRDIEVTVPATMPAVTGVRLRTESAANGLEVVSGATAAPAVRVEPGASTYGLDLTGGEPTVHVPDVPAFRRGVSLGDGFISGGAKTRRLVAIDGATGELSVGLGMALLEAGPQTETLIDIGGATGPPFVESGMDLRLGRLTLLGGPAVTAVRVAPGVAGSKMTVIGDGLLSLGAGPAVACVPGGVAPLAVLIRGIFREGPVTSGAACTVDEQGRRTGDPRFRDRAAGNLEPLWGSSLINGSPGNEYVGSDLLGNPSPSWKGYGPPEEWTGDIGAIEYQFTPAELDSVAVSEPGNRGLVRLSAVAHDTSAEEHAQFGVSYRWQFSDGTELTGANVSHRFALPENVDFEDWYPWAQLWVSEVSGTQRYEYIPLDPWLAFCEAPSDSDDYTRSTFCPKPSASPTPSPQPTATPAPRPFSTPVPRPTQSPSAAARPLVTRFEVVRSRTSARARRSTALAASRPSEAAIRLGVNADAAVALALERKAGRTWEAVPRANVALTAPKGLGILRVTSRFGAVRLAPGLYRLTATVSPVRGGAASVSQQALIRVAR
jgi:hypothetical protein